MKKVSLLMALVMLCSLSLVAQETNLALGKKFTLSPRPNYKLCKDADDNKQLTDGQYVKGYFWTQKGTVGWSRPGTVVVTVDLGKVYPISGFSWNCAAGRAGVEWPNIIMLMVSDDGKTYYPVGDLVELDVAKKPGTEEYVIFKYTTKDVKTYGRYVKFMTVTAGPYIFVDEVEVFLGKDRYKVASRGIAIPPKTYVNSKIFSSYIKKRFNQDLNSVKTTVKNSSINEQAKKILTNKANRLRAKLNQASKIKVAGFRAVFPYNSWHEQLIAIRADVWRAQGMKQLLVNNAGRWDMLKFWDEPDQKTALKPVTITLMRNETRSAVINISNPLPSSAKISLSVTGNIPAKLLSFSQVEWVDTKKGIPVAAALVPLTKALPLTVISGMTRQLWIQADSKNIAAGNYHGNLVLNAGAAGKVNVPLAVKLAPLTFPKRPRLHVGGWDYTDSVPSRGIDKGNIKQVIKHLQERYVDVPWATPATMPMGSFDKTGKMTAKPNTERFDKWLKLWPNARVYAVFLSVKNNIRGIKMSSPVFKIAVANWIKWWRQHCLKQGIKPSQVALLLVDEPHSKAQDDIILAWAKVIKATCPQFIIWEDPTWKTPAKHSVAMLDISDVLCPNRPLYLRSKAYRDFYNERAKKQTLWLYSCSGPNRLLDPYSYFLLQSWECLRIGAKSTHFWAFGDTGGGKSSWNPYLQKGVSYVPYYLDKTSVTPAKYMEAVAESVRDYEYFMMLKDAVAKAKKNGVKQAEVANAEALLKSGPARVLNAKHASAIDWKAPKDRTIADQVRIEALELLVKLR
jgi:hypothetical protein